MTRVGTSCSMRLFLRADGAVGASSPFVTLPEGLRPPGNVFRTVEASGSGGLLHGDVTTDGYVMVPTALSAGDTVLVWGSWPVAP